MPLQSLDINSLHCLNRDLSKSFSSLNRLRINCCELGSFGDFCFIGCNLSPVMGVPGNQVVMTHCWWQRCYSLAGKLLLQAVNWSWELNLFCLMLNGWTANQSHSINFGINLTTLHFQYLSELYNLVQNIATVFLHVLCFK